MSPAVALVAAFVILQKGSLAVPAPASLHAGLDPSTTQVVAACAGTVENIALRSRITPPIVVARRPDGWARARTSTVERALVNGADLITTVPLPS